MTPRVPLNVELSAIVNRSRESYVCRIAGGGWQDQAGGICGGATEGIGIRRIANNLVQQVGTYLARETPTIQVLHSIKTLAIEMAYALEHEEWDYLG